MAIYKKNNYYYNSMCYLLEFFVIICEIYFQTLLAEWKLFQSKFYTIYFFNVVLMLIHSNSIKYHEQYFNISCVYGQSTSLKTKFD